MTESKALRRLRDKLTKENLWLYIIRELAEKPMYAYQVKVTLKEKYNIDAATVTVYTVLYRMEREGLITKVKVNEDKLYKPTDEGLKQFEMGLTLISEVMEKLRR
ncbi:MAG: PadR family transcriptional regulator [Candidatus Nezhaarchaeota archaeon]|nr:PadR family transcriptional regulator [Candidatus Nezhaarchaeota archaeon]MCX8142182.1 PadR family transcriptional regulator [Candidatus Nezhaarchaeota archaeon]MDW8050035.1 PadR family transcriptional regulator [Nitrososphaerota archaeon]